MNGQNQESYVPFLPLFLHVSPPHNAHIILMMVVCGKLNENGGAFFQEA